MNDVYVSMRPMFEFSCPFCSLTVTVGDKARMGAIAHDYIVVHQMPICDVFALGESPADFLARCRREGVDVRTPSPDKG